MDIGSDNHFNHSNWGLILSWEPDVSPTLAVEELSFILEKKNHKIIVVVENFNNDHIFELFKDSSIKERVSCPY